MIVKQYYSLQFCVITVASIAVFTVFLGVSFAAEYTLVWPVESKNLSAAITTTPAPVKNQTVGTNEQYVIQTGVVAIPAKAVEMCAQMTRGDIVQLRFFDQSGGRNIAQAQAAYRVTVQSVKRSENGVVSLTGKVEGHDIETFLLSAGIEGFMITMQDIERKILYRIVGDPRRGEAVVREIDLTKLPPSYDREPLLPLEDANLNKRRKSP